MSESRAAVRYAKAVLELAMEKKAADTVEKDMRLMLETLSENKQLGALLANPVVQGEKKKSALQELFKSANKISKGLLDTLAANKRIGLLSLVAEKYLLLFEKMKGEDVAMVTSAVPLTAALEKKILSRVQQLTGKTVTLQNKIDADIVGGFILRMGDMQYDASLATKLNSLKREFANSI